MDIKISPKLLKAESTKLLNNVLKIWENSNKNETLSTFVVNFEILVGLKQLNEKKSDKRFKITFSRVILLINNKVKQK